MGKKRITARIRGNIPTLKIKIAKTERNLSLLRRTLKKKQREQRSSR